MNEEKKELEQETEPVTDTGAAEAPAAEAETAESREVNSEAAKDPEKEPEKKEKRRFGKKPSKEEEKIESLEKENAELNDRFLRICAEYDNFRKRSQKEKDALYGDIKANTVLQFLPV